MTTKSMVRSLILAIAVLTLGTAFVAEATIAVNAAVFPSGPGR